MVIGACRIELQIPESASLKRKRQVIKSVLARVHHEFNVSIAEVGHQDHWQLATLGVVCVSNDTGYVQGLLEAVVRTIDSGQHELVLLDYEVEIV